MPLNQVTRRDYYKDFKWTKMQELRDKLDDLRARVSTALVHL